MRPTALFIANDTALAFLNLLLRRQVHIPAERRFLFRSELALGPLEQTLENLHR